MIPSRGTFSTASLAFLLCLLLTGCSTSHSFIDPTPEKTNPASNSSTASKETTPSGEKAASSPDNLQSSSLPPDVPPGEAVAPWFDKSKLINQPPDAPEASTSVDTTPQTVWGIVDFRGFPYGQEVAANGVEYNPLFMLGLDFNIMLWRQQRVYLFSELSFWGQKAGVGITNPNQGSFDFSKREFDFNVGVAWNYTGNWEARFFGYSFNNLNRGDSLVSPSGYNDGVAVENRYYLNETYAHLGTAAFDQARATFLSIGYYPSKTMIDGNGIQFLPGPFARAYLTLDLWSKQYYLYGDFQIIGSNSFQPMLFNWDVGLAARPFTSIPRLEFRVGSQDMLNLQGGDLETSSYLSIRYVY